ncbi:MAG: 4-coumarate--CoA ligase, partial [Caulobacter sp.]|nr:4-coumarate--CoA ligase [Caulobacter sp.]
MTPSLDAMMAADFGAMGDILRLRAAQAPDHSAVIMESGEAVTYAAFDALVDRAATALQRDGIAPGQAVAVCALSSIAYAVVFLAGLRAGVAVAPLAPSSTPEAIAGMVADCGAQLFFIDQGVAEALGDVAIAAKPIALDGSAAGEAFAAWLAPVGAVPAPVAIDPDGPFNIIYSSGT